MKQDAIRQRNKDILELDKGKAKEGFKYKVLWKDGKTEYLKTLPKEENTSQILDLDQL